MTSAEERRERKRQEGAKYRARKREQVRKRAREWARKHRAWLKHDAPEEVRELARQLKRLNDALYYERHSEERKAKVKAYAEANKERIREHQRAYRAKRRQEIKEYLRRYRAENRERLNAADREYGRRVGWRKAEQFRDAVQYQIKQSARRMLRSAVAAGLVQKPDHCEGCGIKMSRRKLHGHHHHGYDHPVDVQWLCSICHGKAHRTDAD